MTINIDRALLEKLIGEYFDINLCGHCGRRTIEEPWPVKPSQPAPARHDAPTCPGIWLNLCDWHATHFDQRKIDSGSPGMAAGEWFGPIPEDTK